MDIKWQVGHNFSGQESSLDTGSLETFKKDPIASFAREIVQNSVDAKRNDKNKVIVEFKLFDLYKEEIPDYRNLHKGIYYILENWKEKKGTKKNDLRRMKEMLDLFDKKTITCMRISDFNTTGLLGALKNDETSPFYVLTKGDGVSFKGGTKGGSKGIGKFAAFVVSKVHTVFYSTLTKDKEQAHIGTAKLPSGKYIDENNIVHHKLKTNGEWYYAKGKYNDTIEGQLFLDKKFNRDRNNTGTDIYIIGFDEIDNWQNIMIEKILESFMVAIVKEQLEVIVDNILINNQTVEFLIDNIGLRESSVNYRNIRAMYELLTDESIYHTKILVPKYGTVDLYIKSYDSKESHFASKRVVLVRYPYMKIKNLTGITQLPFSALAIINDDKINSTLRKFENPEHTDWFFKRTDYSLKERKEAEKLFRLIKNDITNAISETLLSSEMEEVDVEGAGEFLPYEETGDMEQEKTPVKIEKPIIHKKKVAKNIDDVGYVEDIESDSFEPELIDGEGEEESYNTDNDSNGSDENENDGKGDDFPSIAKKKLKGIRYHLIAVNPLEGEYIIRFEHTEELKGCDLELKIVGDSISNEKHDFELLTAMMNNKKLSVVDNKIIDFNISKDQTNSIMIKTDQKEIFSGMVNIYASR